MFNRDKGEADLDDEFEDVSFDDDFGEGDYISPIRDEEDNPRKPRHTFKSSKDADVFDNLDDYVEKPKAKPKSSKKKSKSVKRELNDDEDRYYDYEGKGADSVFNLDD